MMFVALYLVTTEYSRLIFHAYLKLCGGIIGGKLGSSWHRVYLYVLRMIYRYTLEHQGLKPFKPRTKKDVAHDLKIKFAVKKKRRLLKRINLKRIYRENGIKYEDISGRADRMTYKLYLNTNHWKRIRLLKLKRNPFCEKCGKKATQVHHLRYKNRKGLSILFKEKMRDFLSLCNDCHEMIHKK